MFGSFSGSGLGFGVAFTLVDRFSQTATRIQQSLSRLGLDVERLQTQVSGGFTKMAIGAAVLGAGLAVLSPILYGIKNAADFEQTTIAFETMFAGIGKSREEAHLFLKDMEEFSATTPFTLPDVEKNTRLLMAMGIEQEKLLPTMRMLGDVSAGLSVPLERLALNYGQIKTLGHLSGKDLRDFATAGVPLLDALAKTTGRTKQDIQENLGSISFDMVEKAFKEGMPQFQNLMMKQSTSLNGIMSNLEDSMTITSRRIGEAFLPIAKKLGVALLSIMTAVRAFVQTPFGKAIMYVVGAVGALLVVAGLVLIVWGAWQIATALLSAAFTVLSGIISVLLVEMLPFILIGAAIAGIAYAVYKLGKNLEAAGAKNNFFVMLVNMGSVLKALWQAWTSFNSATGTFELEGALADKLQKLGLLDFAMGLISWLIRIKAFFVGIWDGMVAGFRFVKQVISEVWGYIKPTVMSFFESMGIHLNRNMSKLQSWATVGKWVGYIIIGILAAIGIAFALMAIDAVIALSPLLLMMYLLYKVASMIANSFVGKFIGKAWNYITGGKDSKDGMSDSNMGNPNPTNPFNNYSPFGQPQGQGSYSPLMMMNANQKGYQYGGSQPTVIDKTQENTKIANINLQMDGETMYSKLLDIGKIQESRK